MNNKVDNRKLSEQIVKLIEDTKTTYDAIEVVEKTLNLYIIDWKKGPVDELSTKNGKWHLRWDYMGWKNLLINNGSEINQLDWNQTLITKINEISAQMHRISLRGGASYIKVHPFVKDLFKTIPFYDEKTSKLSRYDIIYDDSIKINEIYVIAKEWNDVLFIPRFEFGKTTTNDKGEVETELREVSINHISTYTDEEVVEYNKKLLGFIKIDNLPKLEEDKVIIKAS